MIDREEYLLSHGWTRLAKDFWSFDGCECMSFSDAWALQTEGEKK